MLCEIADHGAGDTAVQETWSDTSLEWDTLGDGGYDKACNQYGENDLFTWTLPPNFKFSCDEDEPSFSSVFVDHTSKLWNSGFAYTFYQTSFDDDIEDFQSCASSEDFYSCASDISFGSVEECPHETPETRHTQIYFDNVAVKIDVTISKKGRDTTVNVKSEQLCGQDIYGVSPNDLDDLELAGLPAIDFDNNWTVNSAMEDSYDDSHPMNCKEHPNQMHNSSPSAYTSRLVKQITDPLDISANVQTNFNIAAISETEENLFESEEPHFIVYGPKAHDYQVQKGEFVLNDMYIEDPYISHQLDTDATIQNTHHPTSPQDVPWLSVYEKGNVQTHVFGLMEPYKGAGSQQINEKLTYEKKIKSQICHSSRVEKQMDKSQGHERKCHFTNFKKTEDEWPLPPPEILENSSQTSDTDSYSIGSWEFVSINDCTLEAGNPTDQAAVVIATETISKMATPKSSPGGSRVTSTNGSPSMSCSSLATDDEKSIYQTIKSLQDSGLHDINSQNSEISLGSKEFGVNLSIPDFTDDGYLKEETESPNVEIKKEAIETFDRKISFKSSISTHYYGDDEESENELSSTSTISSNNGENEDSLSDNLQYETSSFSCSSLSSFDPNLDEENDVCSEKAIETTKETYDKKQATKTPLRPTNDQRDSVNPPESGYDSPLRPGYLSAVETFVDDIIKSAATTVRQLFASKPNHSPDNSSKQMPIGISLKENANKALLYNMDTVAKKEDTETEAKTLKSPENKRGATEHSKSLSVKTKGVSNQGKMSATLPTEGAKVSKTNEPLSGRISPLWIDDNSDTISEDSSISNKSCCGSETSSVDRYFSVPEIRNNHQKVEFLKTVDLVLDRLKEMRSSTYCAEAFKIIEKTEEILKQTYLDVDEDVSVPKLKRKLYQKVLSDFSPRKSGEGMLAQCSTTETAKVKRTIILLMLHLLHGNRKSQSTEQNLETKFSLDFEDTDVFFSISDEGSSGDEFDDYPLFESDEMQAINKSENETKMWFGNGNPTTYQEPFLEGWHTNNISGQRVKTEPIRYQEHNAPFMNYAAVNNTENNTPYVIQKTKKVRRAGSWESVEEADEGSDQESPESESNSEYSNTSYQYIQDFEANRSYPYNTNMQVKSMDEKEIKAGERPLITKSTKITTVHWASDKRSTGIQDFVYKSRNDKEEGSDYKENERKYNEMHTIPRQYGQNVKNMSNLFEKFDERNIFNERPGFFTDWPLSNTYDYHLSAPNTPAEIPPYSFYQDTDVDQMDGKYNTGPLYHVDSSFDRLADSVTGAADMGTFSDSSFDKLVSRIEQENMTHPNDSDTLSTSSYHENQVHEAADIRSYENMGVSVDQMSQKYLDSYSHYQPANTGSYRNLKVNLDSLAERYRNIDDEGYMAKMYRRDQGYSPTSGQVKVNNKEYQKKAVDTNLQREQTSKDDHVQNVPLQKDKSFDQFQVDVDSIKTCFTAEGKKCDYNEDVEATKPTKSGGVRSLIKSFDEKVDEVKKFLPELFPSGAKFKRVVTTPRGCST